MYPLAKRSIDYGIRTWDPDHKGALFEPHHNTYDIEFWGAEPMCTSIYIGALSAMAQMAKAVGEPADAELYGGLARKSAEYMDEHLFNGEYYEQKVQYQGLRDRSFAEKVAQVNETSSEMQRLLKREGPKYQYGSGCLSDGVIGVWMARMYGIETPLAQPIFIRICGRFSNTISRPISASMRMRSGLAMRWETSRDCCCAVGRGAASRRCLLSTQTRCGRGSSTRWHRI